MKLTKTKNIDSVTVTEDGTVFYQETTRILEDGIQISQMNYRASIAPGSNLTNIPEKVAQVCKVAWTKEVVAFFNEKMQQK
jgi:alpha-tubulin suppressor-like RCC1 family protein